jgi:hypothetical protein
MIDRDTIIKLAREAGGLPDPMVFIGAYERFATLVAEHEREACAAIVEVEAMTYAEPTWALRIVDRIRARSQS